MCVHHDKVSLVHFTIYLFFQGLKCLCATGHCPVHVPFNLFCNVLNIFMFIIHVDLHLMTITSIESSTLLPIIAVHCLTSELFFMEWGFLFVFLFHFILYFPCNLYFGEIRRIYTSDKIYINKKEREQHLPGYCQQTLLEFIDHDEK